MNLSQLLKTYDTAKKQREKNNQAIRAQIEQRIEEQTITALKMQNHKVNQVHKNQQAIQSKLKKQHELMNEFRHNQQIWINLYEQLNRTLMQAGDLNHYAGYVEAELSELIGEGTLAEYLAQTDREEMPSPKKQSEESQTELDIQAKQSRKKKASNEEIQVKEVHAPPQTEVSPQRDEQVHAEQQRKEEAGDES